MTVSYTGQIDAFELKQEFTMDRYAHVKLDRIDDKLQLAQQFHKQCLNSNSSGPDRSESKACLLTDTTSANTVVGAVEW